MAGLWVLLLNLIFFAGDCENCVATVVTSDGLLEGGDADESAGNIFVIAAELCTP